MDGDLRERLIAEIPGLMAYARTLTRDPHQAEDLVQDTLVRALESATTFRGQASLRTWLHRILHNRAVDQARRTREQPDEAVVELAEAVEAKWRDDAYTVDAAVVVERANTREDLRDALVHLPVIYRSAVLLHDLVGLPMPEVASVQGIGLPAAKQRVRRGRMMLVTQLAVAAERQEPQRVPLRCWDARSRVSDYLDGGLTRSERAALEAHLARCPTCPPLYAGLVGVTEALGALRDPDTVVSTELAARVARHVRAN